MQSHAEPSGQDEAEERRTAKRLVRSFRRLPSFDQRTMFTGTYTYDRNVDNSLLAMVVRIGDGVGGCLDSCLLSILRFF